MKLFYTEKQRKRDIDNALREAMKDNEYLKSMYGRNNFGEYNPLGNDDDPLDYGYNFNVNLYSIISWIYNRASDIPYKVGIYKGNEKIDETKDHEVLDLLECPNPQQGKKEFFQQLIGMYDTFGNGYIYGVCPDFGIDKDKPTQLWVMPSNKVKINAGEWWNPIKSYTIDEDWMNNELEPYKVLHMKYPNLDFNNGQEWYGLSPLQVALNRLKGDKEREELQYKSYANSGAQGIVSRKRANDMSVMPVDQQDRVQRQLNNRLSNKNNRVMFSGDDLNYVQLGLTSHDMQLIEDAKWSLKTLCNLYHVPSQLFNDSESSTYNNMREARKAAILNAVVPKVNMFADEFNRHWINKFEDNIKLEPDLDGIEELQADKRELVEWLDKAHYIKPNEKREMLGKEPDDELEELGYLFPASFLPLEQIEAMNIINSIENGDS